MTADRPAVPTAPEELLAAATDVPFTGWDFTALGDRLTHEPPPWSLEAMVAERVVATTTMLDMGTGGGEWLSRLARSRRVVATESWAPNVPVAAARLLPLCVCLVQDEGATDNVLQDRRDARGRLPFRTGSFDLVVNRHEAFVATEVHRVLRPAGIFVTQQAESGSSQFHRLLGLEPPGTQEFSLALAVEQLSAAGFTIEETGTGTATTIFADIGALAWYLTNVPWAVPGFTVDRHREALLALHGGPIRVESDRFWVRARR